MKFSGNVDDGPHGYIFADGLDFRGTLAKRFWSQHIMLCNLVLLQPTEML